MSSSPDARSLGEQRAALLKELAAAANLGHRCARESASAAVEHVVAAGEALAKARDLCCDGEWTPWIRAHFQGTIRTAQRYIRLARNWPKINSDATRVSPQSQNEAAFAIRRALFGNERSPRPGFALSEQPTAKSTSVAISNDPPATSAAPSEAPRVATLAVAGLERLAVSLVASATPEDTGADYVVSRVRELAADIRLDALPNEPGDKMLYFAEAIGAQRVKIGISSDPQARLASLRTACPHELRIIGLAPGGRSIEAALHAKLADYHLGGEWFFLAKPVRSMIDRLTAAGFDRAPIGGSNGG